MVQEMPSSSVPEELYNLTQLAEVSIAAGKLSTATNASPGEQYHHHHHHLHHYPAQYGGVKYYTLQHESAGYHPTEYYQYALPYHSSLRDDNVDGRKGYPTSPSPPPLEQKKDQQQQQHAQSCSATKKKWKTNWEINRNLKLQQAQRINKIRDADERADGDDSYEAGGGLTYYTSTIRAVESANETGPTRSGSCSRALTEDEQLLDRRSSYASEESEDSSYSYSHKVFDRKKSRTLSWNSGSSYSYGEDAHRSTGGERLEYGIDDREYRELREAGERTTASSGDEVGSTDDVHCCPECGKKYSTSSNLARHRQTHRSLQDKKARRCPHCSKVYVSMPAYSMHVRTHNQGCQCPTCGKCFSRPWLLQGHIRTHTGEKPFKCSVCQKAFADKSNLRAHVQTHSNTKPHSCSRCGKAFALKSYLYKHEDSSCMKNKPGKHPKQGHTKTRRKVEKERGTGGGYDGRYSPGYGHFPTHHQSPQQAMSPMDLALQTEKQIKKEAVRAKIREVLEDNCKKSAQLKAATDNRISVIRTTASSINQHDGYYAALQTDIREGSHAAVERNDSSRSSLSSNSSCSSHYEYPKNYAVIA